MLPVPPQTQSPQARFGEGGIKTQVMLGLDQVHVVLHIPLTFLDDVVCQAWGADPACPLSLRLFLPAWTYLGADVQLECSQASRKVRPLHPHPPGTLYLQT